MQLDRGSPIHPREVSVGNVSAKINGSEMSESLLGMSCLSRLSGFEFSGDKLTLRR